MKFFSTSILTLAVLVVAAVAFPSSTGPSLQARAPVAELGTPSPNISDSHLLDGEVTTKDLVLYSPSNMALDTRQIDIDAGVILDTVKYIVSLVQDLINAIKQDKLARSEFTKSLVVGLNENNNKLNYVVCHTKHEFKFDGERGREWTHRHEEFDIEIGGTIGYEIYAFKSGTFTRQGDGGFLNWAYMGNVVDRQGGRLVMGARA